MLFLSRCEACGSGVDVICESCRTRLFDMPQPVCDDVIVAVAYDGIARRLILNLKYRNRRRVVPLLAELLASRLVGLQPDLQNFCDLVTWAPTSRSRVRGRGHDQSELLARALARKLNAPCKRLLIKTSTNVQTGAGRVARLQGSVFCARKLGGATHIVVVDDVVTTGTTMRCAREALLHAGARQVTCVAIAGALRHSPRR